MINLLACPASRCGQAGIVLRKAPAVLHDRNQQRFAVELFVGLADRVACEDPMIESAYSLRSARNDSCRGQLADSSQQDRRLCLHGMATDVDFQRFSERIPG